MSTSESFRGHADGLPPPPPPPLPLFSKIMPCNSSGWCGPWSQPQALQELIWHPVTPFEHLLEVLAVVVLVCVHFHAWPSNIPNRRLTGCSRMASKFLPERCEDTSIKPCPKPWLHKTYIQILFAALNTQQETPGAETPLSKKQPPTIASFL